MKIESLFVSDVHLGLHTCKTHKFLASIKDIKCKNIFILGDFIDCAVFQKDHEWPNDNNLIIEKLLNLMHNGGKIYYIWGNHDDFLSKWDKFALGKNIEICRTKIYTALNQKKYLLIHGDEFDGVIRLKFLIPLQKFGAFLYDGLLRFNRIVNKIVRKLGWREKYITTFLGPNLNDLQKMTTEEAKRHKCQGVICGHSHLPQHSSLPNQIEYLNCGDWIKSCTYIVETLEGEFKLKKFEWGKPKISVDYCDT